MLTHALFARLTAKPGKEQAVADFMQQALRMARAEPTTPVWFALRLSHNTFGVFDAFTGVAGRDAHLSGPIAQALMASAPDLFSVEPSIEPLEVLGHKWESVQA